jgi:hypothetical protein
LQNKKLNLIIAKEATKFPSSNFDASTCHTNPLFEKDSPNGDTRLDELLSAQKQHGHNTGLGFISKSKKKRNKKKNNKKMKFLVPTPPPKKRIPNDICFDEDGNVFEEERELVKDVIRNAKKAMPNHNNFAEKYNPSYVLCRAYDGHVYAKFVGSPNERIAWSIWVPKTLFTNKRGPIEKWEPKNKT